MPLSIRHHTHNALELEFYIPTAVWDHAATAAFLAQVYALVEGATVVGGAKGVWRGSVETTNLVRIMLRKRDIRFDAALATVRAAATTLMEGWGDSPTTRQASFLFTVRELTLFETTLTHPDSTPLRADGPRSPGQAEE